VLKASCAQVYAETILSGHWFPIVKKDHLLTAIAPGFYPIAKGVNR